MKGSTSFDRSSGEHQQWSARPERRARPGRRARVVLRPARREDCRRIAELFQISSDGIADYLWSTLQDDYPGQAPLEIGRQRYAREDTAFSYQNCVVAELDGAVIALLHAFVSAPSAGVRADEDVDPVLRPYAELEAPGSL